jgi:hypothetical protein
MNSIDVSIVIVSYNTKDLIINCIRSIYDHTHGIDFEIIVVDNASSDGSVNSIKKVFADVIIIDSEKNIGFGRASNLGAKLANGKYLFFLNPDCILIENAIKKMFDFFETHNKPHNMIGAVGCILLDANHKLNSSYHRFPTPCDEISTRLIVLFNKIFRTNFTTIKNINYNLDRGGEVDFITGADLFISKEVFHLLNGFDPSFFMYFEETDLQKRMSKISLKRIILNDVSIIHLEGKATPKKLSSNAIYIDSELKYMKKHFPLILYIVYYIITSFLLIPILFLRKHSKKDKFLLLNVLFRRSNFFK